MDSSELALKLLEWEKKKKELEALEAEIKPAVMELGKTQTVGNVRATFSKGRKKYDYHNAYLDFLEDAEENEEKEAEIVSIRNLHTTEKVDYKAICKDLKIENIEFTQVEPSVSIKLIS